MPDFWHPGNNIKRLLHTSKLVSDGVRRTNEWDLTKAWGRGYSAHPSKPMFASWLFLCYNFKLRVYHFYSNWNSNSRVKPFSLFLVAILHWSHSLFYLKFRIVNWMHDLSSSSVCYDSSSLLLCYLSALLAHFSPVCSTWCQFWYFKIVSWLCCEALPFWFDVL